MNKILAKNHENPVNDEMGWTHAAVPTREKLIALGLDDVAGDFW